MRKARRILAIALCALMLVPALSAGAANQWVFKGHRIDDAAIASGVYAKGWYEVDANGIPTGRVKEEGVAKSVEWRHVWYEKDYPHAEIVALYLEGAYAGIIRESGAVADWEVKYVPEFWEAKYPYRILERLTTILPDGTAYANTLVHRNVTANDLLKYLGRNEAVTQSYEYFGFNDIRIIDKDTIEAANYRPGKELALDNKAYNWAGATTIDGDYIVYAGEMLKEAGKAVVPFPYAGDITGASDVAIANNVKVYKSEYLMGYDYAANMMQKIDTMTYLMKPGVTKEMLNPTIVIDCAADKVAQVTWTNPLYEEEWPYAEYELLVVDGVVMDGRAIGNGKYLPYVYRMTGGYATPDYNNIYNIKNSGWVNPVNYPANYYVAPAGIAGAVTDALSR